MPIFQKHILFLSAVDFGLPFFKASKYLTTTGPSRIDGSNPSEAQAKVRSPKQHNKELCEKMKEGYRYK